MKLRKDKKLAMRKAEGKKKASCELKGFRKVSFKAERDPPAALEPFKSSFIFR